MLTERKAIATFRREQADKRGGGQVRGESIFKAAGAPQWGELVWTAGPAASPHPPSLRK